jgi:hypothetical protein
MSIFPSPPFYDLLFHMFHSFNSPPNTYIFRSSSFLFHPSSIHPSFASRRVSFALGGKLHWVKEECGGKEEGNILYVVDGRNEEKEEEIHIGMYIDGSTD